MTLPKVEPCFTVEEYLAFERDAEERHQYVDGQVWAMAGESGEHGDATTNIVMSLALQLKGKPCRVRSKDTKVRSGPAPKGRHRSTGMYSYPDVTVICGEPEYHDAMRDVILNPKVIIEVLSATTEAFDRGEKFDRYEKWNPTLTDYLLVSQDKPQIEHYRRKPGGAWMYKRYIGLKARVPIASIGCTLALADVYDRIRFAAVQ